MRSTHRMCRWHMWAREGQEGGTRRGRRLCRGRAGVCAKGNGDGAAAVKGAPRRVVASRWQMRQRLRALVAVMRAAAPGSAEV